MESRNTCFVRAMSLAVAMCAAVAAHAAMPISVAFDGSDVVASVPAGTLDETSTFYFVWDDVDRGTNLADWPAANRVKCDVGRVGARPSQYRFNRDKVAPGQVFRVLATSKVRLLGDGGSIYIGCNQYIDTGIKATQVHGLAIKFQYAPKDYQLADKNPWASLMGSLPTDDFTIGRKANGKDGEFYMRYRGESLKADGKTPDLMFTLGDLSVPHTIAIANRTASLDDATVMKNMPAGSIGNHTDAGTILIGCSWDDDCNRGLSGRYCHAKWYSARFDDANGKAIVNLVPARRGGEGVLWDTVSRRVFANAGTGALTFSGTAGAAIDGTEGVCAASCAVVVGNTEFAGKARFTLLTDRMVRCEWSEDGSFEDRPSLTFINRVQPPVKHTFEREGDGAVITTDKMRLEWTGGAFNESNLVVSVANVEMLPMANANVANEGDKPNWKLGIGTGNIGNNGNIKKDMNSVAVLSEDKENLLGTMRTIAEGRDIEGQKYYLVIGTELGATSYINSTFAYTQSYIENNLMPQIMHQRDALLMTGDSATVGAIVASTRKPAYWSTVPPEDENFGLKGYYVQIKPDDKLYDDEVDSYNRLYVDWFKLLAKNEREKIEALRGTNSEQVGTWSVGGATTVTHTENFNSSSMVYSSLTYPGLSFNKGDFMKKNSTLSEAGEKINWKNLIDAATTQEATRNKDPMKIEGQTVAASWSFEFTPIVNIDWNMSPEYETKGHTKAAGFTLKVDDFSYEHLNVSVYRVVDKKSGYNDATSGTRDFTDADNDHLYGSYVYFLNAGATRCPWEGPDSTRFYSPKVPLSAGSLKLENPKLDIDVHERSDVPVDQPAVFNLRLSNEGEAPYGTGNDPIKFTLRLQDGTNPKGAKIYIDGAPLLEDGRTMRLRRGDVVFKRVEVYAGEGYDFENIMLTLTSNCSMTEFVRCTFSAHFMPVVLMSTTRISITLSSNTNSLPIATTVG